MSSQITRFVKWEQMNTGGEGGEERSPGGQCMTGNTMTSMGGLNS